MSRSKVYQRMLYLLIPCRSESIDAYPWSIPGRSEAGVPPRKEECQKRSRLRI